MPKRILIVRLSALGDTALTLPLLFALRRELPEAVIGWVVGRAAAPLLRNLPPLDRLHVWDDRKWGLLDLPRLTAELRAMAYDAAIDPQGLSRSGLLPFLARIPVRVGFSPGPLESRELAPLFTNTPVAPSGDLTHISARTCYLGHGLGLDLTGPGPVELPWDGRAEQIIAKWWRQQGLGARTLVVGIGAGWPTKIWPAAAMAPLLNLAADRGYRCIVLWGPMEIKAIGTWRAVLGNATVWAPPTDIPQMIALLRRCRCYAGPDSAPLHLAWLLQKPTFSWFGASDSTRCAPPGPGHAHVAAGPHTWRRRKAAPTGLHTLRAENVRPRFEKWLPD